MADFVYRYTCKGCGAIREVRTLRELTPDKISELTKMAEKLEEEFV